MAEKPGNSNQGTAIKNHQSPAENTGISLNSGGGRRRECRDRSAAGLSLIITPDAAGGGRRLRRQDHAARAVWFDDAIWGKKKIVSSTNYSQKPENKSLLFHGLSYLVKLKCKNMSVQSIHAFAEKVALITDGENPVGRAVALQLALQGAYVIVGFANSSEENKRAIGELQNLGTLAGAVETDISGIEGAKKLVGAVEQMFGRIDFLVNCLKYSGDSTFEETGEEDFEETFGKSVKAVFFVTKEAVRLMKSRLKPKIVNVVSALDTAETEKNVLFAASQKSVTGLTESFAKLLPKNFRVNAVAVSEKKGKSESTDAELFRPRTGISEDDVARTVLFLLSSEATGLNGQILKVE